MLSTARADADVTIAVGLAPDTGRDVAGAELLDALDHMFADPIAPTAKGTSHTKPITGSSQSRV